jgi:hypothetical protein
MTMSARDRENSTSTMAGHRGARGRARGAILLGVLGALLSLAIASGCASIRVTHDYDPDANFADLETWQWSEKPRALTGDVRIDDNSLLEGRVHSAVEDVLAKKGYTKIESGKPDFLVVYHAAITEKLDVQVVNDYYGYDPAWGWGYQPAGWGTRTYVNQYEEGSLILDIVRPDNHLIWRSTAAAEVGDDRTPEEREERVRASITEMLSRFPPEQATETPAKTE